MEMNKNATVKQIIIGVSILVIINVLAFIYGFIGKTATQPYVNEKISIEVANRQIQDSIIIMKIEQAEKNTNKLEIAIKEGFAEQTRLRENSDRELKEFISRFIKTR